MKIKNLWNHHLELLRSFTQQPPKQAKNQQPFQPFQIKKKLMELSQRIFWWKTPICVGETHQIFRSRPTWSRNWRVMSGVAKATTGTLETSITWRARDEIEVRSLGGWDFELTGDEIFWMFFFSIRIWYQQILLVRVNIIIQKEAKTPWKMNGWNRETWWLEDDVPFWSGWFFRFHVSLPGCKQREESWLLNFFVKQQNKPGNHWKYPGASRILHLKKK